MLRRFLVLMCVLIVSVTCGRGGQDCQGHHWLDAAYYQELHWQFIALGILASLYVLSKGVSWFRRKFAR